MKTYTLQLTEQEIQTVVSALAELKLKDSLTTFASIKNQIDQQNQPVEEKETE